jgi:hypothetical protein
MDDLRALVAYRYSVADIERWPAAVVTVFYQHLRTKENRWK